MTLQNKCIIATRFALSIIKCEVKGYDLAFRESYPHIMLSMIRSPLIMLRSVYLARAQKQHLSNLSPNSSHSHKIQPEQSLRPLWVP